MITTKTSKKEMLLKAHAEHGDFARAVRESGMNSLAAYKILKMNKCFSIDERLRMGTDGSKLGARMENEFQKLVPKALAVNAIKYANPKYDFTVGEYTVDVKASSIFDILPALKDGDSYG